MATTNTGNKNTQNQKPTAAPKATPPAGADGKTAAAPTGDKKPRRESKVRLYSQVAPDFYVRCFQSFIDKHGVPEHGGKPMQAKAGEGGANKSAAKKAEKEAEKAKLAAMSDEEKQVYAKAKREEKQAGKAAKKKAERDALLAELRAELAGGPKVG